MQLGSNSAQYIREGVRRAVFNKTTNQEGAYLYFLPGYTDDGAGNGVWFKVITIRDNFGDNYKEKYIVLNKAEDPAEYFANNFKLLYPDEAAVGEVDVNGKKFKKYPNFGRITQRVLYNVAFANNLKAGAHVLDLPLKNGADSLHNWLAEKDLHGNDRPLINDPERCLAVHVKLKENSSNPWSIAPDPSQAIKLPDKLADADYLYNLDDVLQFKSTEEIIAGLRKMYSREVFNECMDGYDGLPREVIKVAPKAPARKPLARPPEPEYEEEQEVDYVSPPVRVVEEEVKEEDDFEVAKPTFSAPKPAAPVAPKKASKLPANPIAGLSREQARRLLETPEE